ncbi:MAG: glycosyltransferase [Candidatus Firestonebacteria bacterium]
MKSYKGLISVVIPSYNEGSHIYKNIREIQRTFDEFGCKYELIVVNDGSSDDTYEEALKAAKGYNNIVVKTHRKNYGKGRTLKMGCRFAKGDLILFLDADLDLHPGQVPVLFDMMKLRDVDVVIGSKRHPDSDVNYPWHRDIISMVYYFVIKMLFGLPVRDTQTGIKLFKKEVIKHIFPRLLVKRYAYDLELLVMAHRFGYKIMEAPVTLHFQRDFGRITLKDMFRTWMDTMAVFYRIRILRFYNKDRHNHLQNEKANVLHKTNVKIPFI